MKKRMSRLAALSLGVAMLLAACSSGGQGSATPTPAPASEPPQQSEAPTPSQAPAGKIGEGRTLVVGVWGAEQETLVREHVVKPFEEETGAKVELILGGTGDRYSKLYAEVDNPSMDVVYLNMAQTEQATRDGVILPADPEGVANYNNLYDIAKCGDGYGVALMATGLMYNTDLMDTAPTSWADVLSDDYKGLVCPYTMPSSQGNAFLVMLATALGDSKNVDAALEALAAAKPFPLITEGIPERNQAFLDNEVAIGPQINGYVYSAKNEGIPVEFVYPEEGAALSMNCAVIPKNSANADLAKIFINYHLAQACQEAYAEVLYYGPTNSAVTLPDELASAVVYGEDDVAKLVALDNEWVSANEASWTEKWNTMILD